MLRTKERIGNVPEGFLHFIVCQGDSTPSHVSESKILVSKETDCVGATSSSKEELDQFITAVNSFHPALKYTWEISENSLAFLNIKLSITDNSLSTSVHYKPTDSHNYLLHSPFIHNT